MHKEIASGLKHLGTTETEIKVRREWSYAWKSVMFTRSLIPQSSICFSGTIELYV